MNITDMRIYKMWTRGLTLSRIAKRIGRPNDIQRVLDGLQREGIPKDRWYENERKGIK